MKKIKVMFVFGTRPEAIKMDPIIKEMEKERDIFEPVVVVTGQHKEMLDQVLSVLKIKVDYNLKVMEENQTLNGLTIKIMKLLEPIINSENPNIILVHGDTATTLASSLCAFYSKKIIGHVEAGLRTWKKYSPYPEEMNRQLTDVLSDLYFAPTEISKQNLLVENHNLENIFVTGNTAVDEVNYTVSDNYTSDLLNKINDKHRIILLTLHRRENQGKTMLNIFEAIKELVESRSDIDIIYPVHLNPNVNKLARKILGETERIHLISPLDVFHFHNLISKSYFVMTDSGGVQEEAPALHKPVLVLRDTTERPEGVKSGTLKLIGTDPQKIKSEVLELLENKSEYMRMANAKNPYGDGKAAFRILKAIKYYFNYLPSRPNDFE
ncbi:MAG: UDP-N-acetylglucosamine 2-epimerase (non-hydrolyzing) [Liquorilactobacillus ghanensis]|uniref:non-hydrolyzing UDP-N-acetylglucosamine 2-epimerase n=1 Tax=Liquorilactobacillus ghanensis TaxID=399370 RepID=UPI0039E91566